MIFITIAIGFVLSTSWIVYEYYNAPEMEEVNDIMDNEN
jgi:hypothetical protein